MSINLLALMRPSGRADDWKKLSPVAHCSFNDRAVFAIQRNEFGQGVQEASDGLLLLVAQKFVPWHMVAGDMILRVEGAQRTNDAH